MPRRIALALSLAFTTVVTFALVSLGVNAGFFSDEKKSSTTQKAHAADEQIRTDDANAALLYLAAVGEQSAQARPGQLAPRVVTEYVYVYETPVPRALIGTQSRDSAPPVTPPSTVLSPTEDLNDERPDDEEPPSATPRAQPTTAPPTPRPTASPQQATCRDEFESTVTATTPISGGRLVTWTNGIQTNVPDSTPHASSLQTGVRAQVHATASGGCTVTEIELDD